MTVDERIRAYETKALQNVMNGDDPDGDVNRMYIPHEYSKALYKVIIHDLMVHLAAHSLSHSTAMDVYIQWTEMYEGKVIDRGPAQPARDPDDMDF